MPYARPLSYPARLVLLALVALALVPTACAGPEKTKRDKKVERYGGPVVDLRAVLQQRRAQLERGPR